MNNGFLTSTHGNRSSSRLIGIIIIIWSLALCTLVLYWGKTVASLSELRAELKGYNSEVLDKIDELKMYLLNSKISLKGESERENGKDNNHFY